MGDNLPETSDHAAAAPDKRVCVITTNFKFVEALQAIPARLTYDTHSGTEANLLAHITRDNPDVIVVVSNGGKSVISGYQVCRMIKRECAIPVVLIHSAEYRGMPLDSISDMDTVFPETYQSRFNLVVELLRIAHGVPQPRVSLTQRSTFRWRIILGLIVSTAATLAHFALFQDLQRAGETGAVTFSAITGTEAIRYIRQLGLASRAGSAWWGGRSLP